jgi:phosphoribosylanthranilate isomerase
MIGVKICGLTRHADARDAVAWGATHLGVILAGGVRHLSVEAARDVLDGLTAVQRTAVFAAQPVEEIVQVARDLSLDVIQLHGDPDEAQIDRLRAATSCAVWPVLRVDGTELPVAASRLGAAAGWLVLDSKVIGQRGGTGVALDWAALAEQVRGLRSAQPGLRIVLAGGLRPTNVKSAIDLLLPDIVDVSSGVERAPGLKDAEAVRAFIRTARAVRTDGEGNAG